MEREKDYHVEPLISEEAIAQAVGRVAESIVKDYAGEEVLLVGLLKGAIPFLSDLMRALSKRGLADIQVDSMGVGSYGEGMTSSKAPKITQDMSMNIDGKNVILVEDIVDTGYSMRMLLDLLQTRNPKSLRVAAFLSKDENREVEVPVDYLGIHIPNVFVVGYGLDYGQNERQLPYIGVVIKH